MIVSQIVRDEIANKLILPDTMQLAKSININLDLYTYIKTRGLSDFPMRECNSFVPHTLHIIGKNPARRLTSMPCILTICVLPQYILIDHLTTITSYPLHQQDSIDKTIQAANTIIQQYTANDHTTSNSTRNITANQPNTKS